MSAFFSSCIGFTGVGCPNCLCNYRGNYVDSIESLKLDGKKDKNNLHNETEVHSPRATKVKK